MTAPNTPGSPAAVDAGCTCPVLDNHYGAGLGDGTFWINGDCPMHGRRCTCAIMYGGSPFNSVLIRDPDCPIHRGSDDDEEC